jgi:hypothetical protein
LREFLRKEIEEYRYADENILSIFRGEFINATTWVERIFGDKALKQYKIGDENKFEGHWVRNKYDLIYDVEMVGFAQFDKQLSAFWESTGSYEKDLFKIILINRLVNVMCRDTFVSSINEGTMRYSAVRSRFDPWLQTMEFLTKDIPKTLQESKSLIDTRISANNVCFYCNIRVPEEETIVIVTGGKPQISHTYCQKMAQYRSI